MGNDGGSIARREELVRTKAVSQKAHPDTVRQALWSLCTLSRQPLRPPVVSDALGRLYNKDAVVQYLLHRNERARGGVDDIAAGHIRGLKDVKQLTLTRNPNYRPPSPTSSSSESAAAAFICPLTAKEMNGKHRFVYITTCGCVMSESGLRAIASEARPSSSNAASTSTFTSAAAAAAAAATPSDDDVRQCPMCTADFRANALVKGKEPEAGGQVVLLNPPKREEDEMRKAMEAARAKEAARKKAAKASNGDAHSTSTTESAEADERKRKKAEKKAAREAKIAALTAELAENGSSPQRPARPADPTGGDDDDDASTPSAKRARLAETTRPSMSVHAPGVHAAMRVAEFTKQQQGAAAAAGQPKAVSAAIASLYGSERDPKATKESWMNRGTYSR
ncbi:Replication termination factor 2 [Thecaphora frezii]